tara:strand:+ start:1181 stop:1519 length:339 start_codon:yes stop_codon:yes gene_type:complete
MNVIGKLVKKLDVESGISKAGKEWKKQSILVKQSLPTGFENKENVVITFFGDKMQSIRDVQEGSDVDVSVNLSSREFNGKYYHNIDGWLCAKLGQETVENDFVTTDDNDLPF